MTDQIEYRAKIDNLDKSSGKKESYDAFNVDFEEIKKYDNH